MKKISREFVEEYKGEFEVGTIIHYPKFGTPVYHSDGKRREYDWTGNRPEDTRVISDIRIINGEPMVQFASIGIFLPVSNLTKYEEDK